MPVRCQTHGVLPSHRASPPVSRYQNTLLGDWNIGMWTNFAESLLGLVSTDLYWSQVWRRTRCALTRTWDYNCVPSVMLDKYMNNKSAKREQQNITCALARVMLCLRPSRVRPTTKKARDRRHNITETKQSLIQISAKRYTTLPTAISVLSGD